MFYIPLFRTLSAQSTEIITRTHRKQTTEKTVDIPAPDDTKFKGADESSLEDIPSPESEVNVEVITEEVPKERVLKYIPYGNYKWSSIEIDTRDPQRPTLKLEVMIDGKSSHQCVNLVPLLATSESCSQPGSGRYSGQTTRI